MRIADWQEKIFWLNGWNTEEDCRLTGKYFLTQWVEHWGGLQTDRKRFSDSMGGTLRRIADWQEKIFWLDGWNTEEDCRLIGKDFLVQRVEHWWGLQTDRKRFSGSMGGTLWRIAFWREKTFWPNGWDTDEDCRLKRTGFMGLRPKWLSFRSPASLTSCYCHQITTRFTHFAIYHVSFSFAVKFRLALCISYWLQSIMSSKIWSLSSLHFRN